MAVIEDSLFEGNIQEDGALVMSQGVGAYVEMARNRFVENSGGLVSLSNLTKNYGSFLSYPMQRTHSQCLASATFCYTDEHWSVLWGGYSIHPDMFCAQ
jgi:hypothetical protein